MIGNLNITSVNKVTLWSAMAERFCVLIIGGDPGGKIFFGGGDSYGSVPPNNCTPVIYILWVIGFYRAAK